MNSTVGIDVTATDKGMAQLLDKQNKLLDGMVRRMGKVEQASTKANNAAMKGAKGANTAINNGVKSVGNFVAAFTGIGTVVGGVLALAESLKAEFEAAKERQEKARFAQMTAGEAVHAARLAFTGDETVGTHQLEDKLLALSQETSTPIKMIAAAATDAFSAKGELSNQSALDAIREAFRLKPGDVEAGTTLAGRALDVAKTTGQTDMRAIIGFLQNVQSSSRVTSLDKVGSTAVPAISAMAAIGDSAEESAEIFAAVTSLMKDTEGRLSKTATISLANQLNEFNAKSIGKDDFGTFQVGQNQIDRFNAATSTQERIRVMQESPELRRAFMARASFAEGATGAMRQLLEGQGSAVKALETTKNAIGGVTSEEDRKKQVANYEAELAENRSGKFYPQYIAELRRQTQRENKDLLDPMAGRTGEARRELEAVFSDVNFAGLDKATRFAEMANFESKVASGTAPEQAAKEVLKGLVGDNSGSLGSLFTLGLTETSKSDQQRLNEAFNRLTETQKLYAEQQQFLLQLQQQQAEHLRQQNAPKPEPAPPSRLEKRAVPSQQRDRRFAGT